MSEVTKACSLTKDEVNNLLGMHGCNLGNADNNDRIERINYLYKRLKSFDEVEISSNKLNETQDETKKDSW